MTIGGIVVAMLLVGSVAALAETVPAPPVQGPAPHGDPGAPDPSDPAECVPADPAPEPAPPAPPAAGSPDPVAVEQERYLPAVVRRGPAAPAVPIPIPAVAGPGARGAPPAGAGPGSDPARSEPGATAPAAAPPGATGPGAVEPDAAEPGATEPGAAEPRATEPAATEPGAVESPATGTAPSQDEPEPGPTPPGQSEPAPEPGPAPVEDCPPADPGGSAGSDTSAATVFGWGEPNRSEEFDDALGPEWNVYDGPGHAGNGRRTPDAVSIEDGIMTITGDSRGATAGMAWNPGQKYGRWEGRVRAPASDESYNALLLLWPDAENFPVGGEIDFMEMLDHTRQRTNIFLHYGPNNDQVVGEVEIDGTQWHNWAVEWAPTHVAAFVDGKEWWRTTDVAILPPGPMHLCIQLDWFPQGGNVQESYMHVDWVKQYSLDPSDMLGGAVDDGLDAFDEVTGTVRGGVADAVGSTGSGPDLLDGVTGALTEGGPDPVPARRGLVDRAVAAVG